MEKANETKDIKKLKRIPRLSSKPDRPSGALAQPHRAVDPVQKRLDSQRASSSSSAAGAVPRSADRAGLPALDPQSKRKKGATASAAPTKKPDSKEFFGKVAKVFVATYPRRKRKYLPSTNNRGGAGALVKQDQDFKANKRKVQEDERPLQRANHLSSILLSIYPKGIEFQVSFNKHDTEVIVSSNLNAVNKKIAIALGATPVARQMTTIVTTRQALGKLLNQAADPGHTFPKDVRRHKKKLGSRFLQGHWKDQITIHIPGSETSASDGKHAERRIIASAAFDKQQFNVPMGTKYPCISCADDFVEKGVDLGTTVGGLHLSKPGILIPAGRQDIDLLTATDSDVADVAKDAEGMYKRIGEATGGTLKEYRDSRVIPSSSEWSDND